MGSYTNGSLTLALKINLTLNVTVSIAKIKTFSVTYIKWDSCVVILKHHYGCITAIVFETSQYDMIYWNY